MNTPCVPSFRGALSALVCWSSAFLPVAAQNARLADEFSDHERSTQSLPASGAWYASSGAASLAVVDERLAFAGDPNGAQHIVTYFTNAGEPQRLGVGDTLTVSFDFTPTTPGDANSGWRIALLDSGGVRVTSDGNAISNSSYSRWTGYAVMLNPGGPTGTARFWKRTGTSSTLLASTSPYTGFGPTVPNQPFTAGTSYTGILTVTRTLAGLDLAVSFSGGSITSYTLAASDSTNAFVSFDALAIAINRAGTTPAFRSLAIDNVYVGYSPLLNEQFADGERAAESLPGSAAWVTSGAGSSLQVNDGQLVMPGDAAEPQHVLAYFTPCGRPLMLGHGEQLTTTFDFEVTSPTDMGNGWRVGLFNSGGARVTADGMTTADAAYANWTGYAAMLSPGGPAPARWWKRTGTSDSMLGSLSAFTALGSPSASQALVPGIRYAGTLQLTRTAAGLDLVLYITGGELAGYLLTASDTMAVPAFDTLGMAIDRTESTPAMGTLVLDNIVVTHSYRPAAIITLSDLEHRYDGSAKAASVSTLPAGLAVSLTYNGATTPPVDAGVYAVAATVQDEAYIGSAKATLVIAKAQGGLSLGDLSQIYDGEPKFATVATTPAGLQYRVSYADGTPPIDAGAYEVSAVLDDVNYEGSACGTLVVAQAEAELTVDGLVRVYDGAPKTVSVSTAPVGLPVVIHYDGSVGAPTAAGSYQVTAVVESRNYVGAASATLSIVQDATDVGSTVGAFAMPTTALVRHAPHLQGRLTGSLQLGLPESVTLNGGAIISGNLLAPGTPVARLNGHPTFGGSLDGAGAITPEGYTVTLNGGAELGRLVRRSDPVGFPVVHAPAAPAGGRNVTLNHSESTVGDFETLRDLTLNGHVGAVNVPPGVYGRLTANGQNSFILGESGATVPAPYEFQGLQLNAGSSLQLAGPVILRIAGGLNVNGSVGSPAHPEWLMLKVSSGSVILNAHAALYGVLVAPSSQVILNGDALLAGRLVADRLTLNGNAQLMEATANASVTLGELEHTYDGMPRPVTATTVPEGLSVTVTYDGGATPPRDAGSYTVCATINSLAYAGSVSGTLVIAPAQASVSLANLRHTFDGGAKEAAVTTEPAGLNVAVTYDGSEIAPSAIGSYSVVATVTDPNFVGSASGVLEIKKASVLTAYEMLGNPMFGCTQGDLSEARATKTTFTVMTTGRMYRLAVQTQGLRPNTEWGDLHARGDGGSYHVRIYAPAPGGAVASAGGTATGAPQGNMTLLGSTQNAWYPARTVGGFQAPRDLWPSTENQTIPDSVTGYVGGAQVQSWLVRSGTGRDADTGDSNVPPPGFVGSTRASVTSIVYVDLYEPSGEYGIPVTQGQVLCVSHENQDPSPTLNYSHNNEAHAAFAPLPAYGLATPLDPGAGVYFNAGNRDWRKLPHFSVQIDDTWYGQPVYIRDGNNVTDDNLTSDGAARLLYGPRYARQIITPPADYDRTMSKLWINAVRFAGKAGYADAGGRLQVRILRAPLGTTEWNQIWPASGWSTFPPGTFGAHSSVITGGSPPSGSAKITAAADLAKLVTYGVRDLAPALRITGDSHYAIEVRVDPETPTSAFYLQATYSPYYIYNRNRPPGRPIINYPSLLPYGSSGQGYNRAEISGDGGSSWESFRRLVPGDEDSPTMSIRVFPIAFEPLPL